MKRTGKCIFTAVMAMTLLFTMPGMASYAETGNAHAEEISGDTAGQVEAGDAEKLKIEKSKTVNPKTEDPKAENFQAEDAKTEEPKTEDSREEEPETEEPKDDDSKTENIDKKNGEETDNSGEIQEEDEGETEEDDSVLMESAGPGRAAARSGAQSERTEASIASVTVDGETKYYEHLDYLRIAWREAQGKTALIRILQDVDLGRYELTIDNEGSDFTLEMEEGVTLSGDGGSSGKRGFMLVYAGSLTMKSGTLHNTMSLQGWGIDIRGASFILEGGTVKTDGSDGWNTAVHAQEGSTVLIKGGEIIADKYGLYAGNSSLSIEGGKITAGEKGSALFVSNCAAAEITGGEFTGGERGIYLEAGAAEVSGGTFTGNSSGAGSGDKTAQFRLTGGTFISTNRQLSGGNGKPVNWLEEGYCYYDLESGNIIPSAQLKDYYIKGYSAVRVGECNHSSWEDWTIDEEDNHSHVCEGCGKTEAAPHQWDADKRCTVCGSQAAACVKTAGETTYYALLQNAWKAAQGKKATVELLQSVNLEEDTLEVNDAASDIRLEMAEGVILERPKNAGCLIHVTAGSFTFAGGTARVNYPNYADQKEASVILVDGGDVRLEGGVVTNTSNSISWYGSGIKVNGGRLAVSGGEIVYPNARSVGVQVSGGEASIQGGSITAAYRGIEVTGGTLTVEGEATLHGTSGYVYYKVETDGNRTVVTPSGETLGTVTVDLCDHDYGAWTADGTGSHSRICKRCSVRETEDCDYEYSDVSGAGVSGGAGAHVGVCKLCGHRTAEEAHDFASWGPSGAADSYIRTCKACGRQHTAAITRSAAAIQAAYGTTGEQELSCEATGASASYVWKLQGAEEILGTEKGYALPNDLPVGNYTYQCAVTLEGDSKPVTVFSYSLSVTRAELTEAAVTVAEGEGIFYDGKEKEPDVTVELRGKTLTRDVDYTVSYADHVKAGTGTLTVTGIGNYAGTLTKTFAIRYYETEAAAEGSEGWCNRARINAPEGFTISTVLDGAYGDAFYYSTETGAEGAEIPYYLKQDGTGYIVDAKTVRVKVDTTKPSLEGAESGIKITDRDAWWQKLLSKITFGHYKTQVVNVQASDGLSGIDRIYYYIDRTQREAPLTAEELSGVSADQWASSDSVTSHWMRKAAMSFMPMLWIKRGIRAPTSVRTAL